MGLAWLEGPVLAVAMERGPRMLIHLHSAQGALSGLLPNCTRSIPPVVPLWIGDPDHINIPNRQLRLLAGL